MFKPTLLSVYTDRRHKVVPLLKESIILRALYAELKHLIGH